MKQNQVNGGITLCNGSCNVCRYKTSYKTKYLQNKNKI